MKYFLLFIKKLFRYTLKPLSFVPAILMMYVIFSFSAQTGLDSGSLSDKISHKIVAVIDEKTDLDLTALQIEKFSSKLEHYIRKLAHFGEYFLLAVSVAFPLYVYKLRGFPLILTAGLFCFSFACLDEYHQSFVPGRVASKKDILIDSFGALFGIICTRIVGFIGRKTIFKPLSLEKEI